VWSGAQKTWISPKRCMIWPRLLWRTNRKSHIRAFDWHQNQRSWVTLNGQNVTFAEMKSFFGGHQKNLNEARPILLVAECRSMFLVSQNIRYMRIFAPWGSSGRARQTTVGLSKSVIFNVCYWLYVRKRYTGLSRLCIQHIYMQSLDGFSVISKWMTLDDRE